MEKALNINNFNHKIDKLIQGIKKYVKGKDDVIINCLCALFSKGHILIEDVPGVGKTTLANSVALSTDLNFKRIQFTSDLLPSDILGITIFDQQNREFVFKPGPIFTNIVLADEINRTTPKTQSALLEAMNEFNVTVDGVKHILERPFMVIATQNPFEYHGTFPLPESQIDRFSIRLEMGYPGIDNEKEILKQKSYEIDYDNFTPSLSKDDIMDIQDLVEDVHVDNSILDYLLSIVERTRDRKTFEMGISPRGAISLKKLAQARAVVYGRNYCIPDDVKKMVFPAFVHRIVLNSSTIYSENNNENKKDALDLLLKKLNVPI